VSFVKSRSLRKKDRAGKPVMNLEISSLQQLAIYYELDSSEDNDFD
jgi:hypothetical protein